jgi:uncharacterized protein YdcH (DUF465 family)
MTTTPDKYLDLIRQARAMRDGITEIQAYAQHQTMNPEQPMRTATRILPMESQASIRATITAANKLLDRADAHYSDVISSYEQVSQEISDVESHLQQCGDVPPDAMTELRAACAALESLLPPVR